MEIGELLQYYMLNAVINFLFKNFIALWRHLAKTQLLSFIHIVQIDLRITQYSCFRYSPVSNIQTHATHASWRNAREALRKEKYASKIKSAQETQQTQENYASEKQKYASASHATVLAQENATIESILFFHATHASHATQALALLAFE